MAANKTKTSSLSAQDRSGSELMQGSRRESRLLGSAAKFPLAIQQASLMVLC